MLYIHIIHIYFNSLFRSTTMVIKTVKGKKLDIKPKEIRYRLLPPSKFDTDSFRRKEITDGVSIVIACTKGNFKKGRCKTGTKTQALRFDSEKFTAEKAATWINQNWNKKKQ